MNNTTLMRIHKSVLKEIDKLKRECSRIEEKDLPRHEIVRRMVNEDVKKLLIKDAEIKRRLRSE